jgi:hypothetical protein
VTGGAFALLGIAPRLGRAIQPEDDVARGGHPVVMLSHGYWQRAFGGDPQVVGRTLQMGRRSYTIVGVAPADYRGGLPAVTPAFYLPMSMLDEVMGIEMLDQRDFHSFAVKARLASGVTREQAEHAASLVATSLTAVRPEGWTPGEQFALVPTADVHVLPGVDSLLRAAAWLLLAVVALVLLLACTNLASFLLARALDRRQEVAVRRAMGATRGMLARQLLVESALLGLGGAAGGLVVALVLLNVLLSVDLPLPMASGSIFTSAWTRRHCSTGEFWRLRPAAACWREVFSDSSPPFKEHVPILAQPSRQAAAEATGRGLSGGAAHWSSRRSPCRWCCSWAPGCS